MVAEASAGGVNTNCRCGELGDSFHILVLSEGAIVRYWCEACRSRVKIAPRTIKTPAAS